MNKPLEISPLEWAEIVKVEEVREGWGLEDHETPEAFSSMVYGVKFNFVSGGPGYTGDLYILQGDSIERPLVLVRNEGHLTPVE